MGWTDDELATQVADDIEDGWTVNLGVGLPTLVANRLVGRAVLVHAENGILGVGPRPVPGEEDPEIIDPGKNPVTVVPGAAFMDSLTSFGLIRGGHLDLAVMGAFQVSEHGDLANWRLPGRRGGAIGGAADLAAGARQVWVMTTHATKDGAAKLVRSCTYPLTATGVVSRVYTELGAFDVADGRLRVRRLAPGVTTDEAVARTEATLEPVPVA
ncbi:MAG TPA: 3-oxoacid CoA-transferase subunit B [Candidatus Limnocylindrales bacterium]|jgi:3-oxoacid CoA-transferase B subunit|nr:3-oxoacid CoA-transferase subunit B [Candidatus Limnocylindrales bacterium]